MSPYSADRDEVRVRSPCFVEVFVDAPLAVCQQRDPSGIYKRFEAGEIRHLSGLDEPYERPRTPEVHCRTAADSLETSTGQVMAYLRPLFVHTAVLPPSL